MEEEGEGDQATGDEVGNGMVGPALVFTDDDAVGRYVGGETYQQI